MEYIPLNKRENGRLCAVIPKSFRHDKTSTPVSLKLIFGQEDLSPALVRFAQMSYVLMAIALRLFHLAQK